MWYCTQAPEEMLDEKILRAQAGLLGCALARHMLICCTADTSCILVCTANGANFELLCLVVSSTIHVRNKMTAAGDCSNVKEQYTPLILQTAKQTITAITA